MYLKNDICNSKIKHITEIARICAFMPYVSNVSKKSFFQTNMIKMCIYANWHLTNWIFFDHYEAIMSNFITVFEIYRFDILGMIFCLNEIGWVIPILFPIQICNHRFFNYIIIYMIYICISCFFLLIKIAWQFINESIIFTYEKYMYVSDTYWNRIHAWRK